MKFITESKHESFGYVSVKGSRKDKHYVDGELHLRQRNGEIFLTPNQVVELRDILILWIGLWEK